MADVEIFEQEVIEFVNEIVPANWNVLSMSEEPKSFPAALNIYLWFPGGIEELEECGDTPMGEAEPIRYYNCMPGSKGMTIGITTIRVYPIAVILGWAATIIHELAHIAVARWESCKAGKSLRDKSGPYSGIINQEPAHGGTFQRAYRTIIHRAERVYGTTPYINLCKSDLEGYKERQGGTP